MANQKTSVQEKSTALTHAVKRIYELEQEQLTSKDALAEIDSLKQQIVNLKKLFENEREQFLEYKQQHSQQVPEPQPKSHDSSFAEQNFKALQESQQRIKQLERVIHFLRERSESSQLELRQLKNEHYQKQSQHELDAINKQTELLENRYEQLKSIISHLNETVHSPLTD